jgi:nitrite reductase/ring-hydroxylating ferredoxin subunit
MPRIELKLSEIPFEGPFHLEHLGTPIVLIRDRDNVVAYLDRCPHAQWPVSEGEIDHGILHCPGHGWQFDVVTGRCLNAPAYRLKPFSVTLSDDSVLIEWNEADMKSDITIGDDR